ncbi:hypothetical protein AKO1_013531 [Acrasis kona]|uniref:CHASE domain-containing protein n=1 Tax=Acrasis kona TaxID=1008807 RepID=A0AAW2ZHR5_9EUKA
MDLKVETKRTNEGSHHSSDTVSSKDTSSSSKIRFDNLAFRITYFDVIIVVVGVIFAAMCLAGGLIGYFTIKRDYLARGKTEFNSASENAVASINQNLKSVTNDLLMLRTMFELFDNPHPYKQITPFIGSLSSTDLNGDGVLDLPPYVAAYFYVHVVDNATSYLSHVRQWGDEYANLTYITGMAGAEPDIDRPYYYVVDYYIPLYLKAVGFNYGSDELRNRTLTYVLSRNETYVSDLIVLLSDAGKYNGIIVYVPVNKNNTVVGVACASFRLTTLLKSSSDLGHEQGMAVIDTTIDNTVLTVITNGFNDHKSSDSYTYTEVQDLLKASTYSTSNQTITLYNRKYQIIYFTRSVPYNYLNIIPLIVCAFVFLIGIVLLILVSVYRRAVVVKKVQELTRNRVEVLEAHRAKLSLLLKKSVKSEAKSRSIINSIPDLVVVINRLGVILQCNNSFDRTYTFSEQEWSNGIRIQSLLPELDDKFYECVNFKESIHTNAVTRDYTKFEVEVKIASMLDDPGVSEPHSPMSATDMKTAVKMNKIDGHNEEDESYVLIIRKIESVN